ncbi:MAG: 50S ribosomal protein L23 [Patescibacteria group bacterium]
MSFFERFTKKKKQERLENFGAAPGVEKTPRSVSHIQESGSAPQQISGIAYTSVLAYPVVSEKAADAEAEGVYTFVVERTAKKPAIRRAMLERYGVNPKKIRIMNYDGKRLRFGRNGGRRTDWKKAMVTLPKGKTIHVHEGV